MNGAASDSSHLVERRSHGPGRGGGEQLLEAAGDLEKVQHGNK